MGKAADLDLGVMDDDVGMMFFKIPFCFEQGIWLPLVGVASGADELNDLVCTTQHYR